MTRLAFGAKCGSAVRPPVFGSRASWSALAASSSGDSSEPERRRADAAGGQPEQLPAGEVKVDVALNRHVGACLKP